MKLRRSQKARRGHLHTFARLGTGPRRCAFIAGERSCP